MLTAASQALDVLGRGVRPHASDNAAALLRLDVLKHLKDDAVVEEKPKEVSWQQQARGGQASAWPAFTGPSVPGVLRCAGFPCIFYSCGQVTATHASSL